MVKWLRGNVTEAENIVILSLSMILEFFFDST
jgi:hypothetical protein